MLSGTLSQVPSDTQKTCFTNVGRLSTDNLM